MLTFADFTGTPEADIEDMFEMDFYLDLVNAEFKRELTKKITKSSLAGQSPRILRRIEDWIEQNPLKNGSKFSHYRPARYFAEQIAALSVKLSVETLDRFEAAFSVLNKLL